MNNIKQILKELFPGTQDSVLEEASLILEIYASSFGVNTKLRLCHFLAQVREEVGPIFKPTLENLNYKADRLIDIFSKRFDMNGNKQLDEFEINLIKSVVGYPEQIASIVYANRLGNGDIGSGDGWKFRGAGCLQITGRSNFEEVQKRISKYAPASGIDIVSNPECIGTLKGSILAGLGFWMWKDLYKIADLGSEDKIVDKVTSIINKYTDSYEKRRLHFSKIKKFLS